MACNQISPTLHYASEQFMEEETALEHTGYKANMETN